MITPKFLARILLEFIGETNIFISLTAAVSAYAAFTYFGYQGSFTLSTAIFFSALFTYNAQRLIGDLKKRATFRLAKKWLSVISLFAAPFFLFQLGGDQIAVLAFAGAISIGYAVPFIPGASGLKSLRKIPRLKIWLIALVWVLVIAVVPLLGIAQKPGGMDVLPVFLYILQQTLLVMGLTIPFDVRDLEVDHADQKTLPMTLGVNRALRLGQFLMAVFILPAFLSYYMGYCTIYVFAVQLAVAATGIWFIPKTHSARSPLFFLIMLDGVLLLQAVLVLGVRGAVL
ncbi:MAG: hypothetical protein ABR574_01725 [Cryomorphaceae bacterium]|nr:hypothetical protein [Flavobacteriales bacterium]